MFAVIIPYRHRDFFLKILLEKLTNYLEGSFVIIVSQQKDGLPFNLGLSRNIGAVFAECYYKHISHFIFNDVDTIPLKSIDYSTPENIIHFMNFGSVKIIKKDFFKINGYNPLYNGWGHEDCEFCQRLEAFDIFYKKEFAWIKNHASLELEHQDLSTKEYTNLEWEYFRSDGRLKIAVENALTQRNEKILNFFTFLSKEKKKIWASTHGINLININKIKLDAKIKNIFFISYNSANCF